MSGPLLKLNTKELVYISLLALSSIVIFIQIGTIPAGAQEELLRRTPALRRRETTQ